MEQQNIKCAFCRGTGNNPHFKGTCPVCKGRGKNEVVGKYMTCSSCRGSGQKGGTTLTCYDCRGLGVVPDTRETFMRAREEIREAQEEIAREKEEFKEKRLTKENGVDKLLKRLKKTDGEDKNNPARYTGKKKCHCQSCARELMERDTVKVCLECFRQLKGIDIPKEGKIV